MQASSLSQVHVLSKNVRLLTEHVVQKLAHQKPRPTVLLLTLVQLFLNLNTVLLQLFVILLAFLEVLFDLLKTRLEHVDELLALGAILRPSSLVLALHEISELMFQLLSSSFKARNLALTSMCPLGQLLLHLLVQGDVAFQSVYLDLHFIIFGQKLFCLLRLVFELRGQLVVLQDGQPSRCLELLVIQGHQISLGLLNFVVHLFAQFLDCVDLGPFEFVDFDHASLLLVRALDLQLSDVPSDLILFIFHML